MTSQLNGSEPKRILGWMKRSRHIFLDTLNRWLYWDAKDPQRILYKTNLDAPGYSRYSMSPIDAINCLFIDNQGNNLYWVDNIVSNLKSLNLSQPGSNVTELYQLPIAKPVGIALHGGHFFALYGDSVIQYQLDTPEDEVRFDVTAWSLDGVPFQIKMKRARGLFVRRF
ncbi:uncharacterized protein LOC105444990 [Strongylocentrotus purpuratus]|uniref:Uncharacterized protein n=1 Tax=Strongylocentrotus purpuratus TaxID=7668 RepID=A0A7M7T264_STRPU|nr:uncharacterized protein LOC105444990 [Strongylocentrotus purpuratus]